MTGGIEQLVKKPAGSLAFRQLLGCAGWTVGKTLLAQSGQSSRSTFVRRGLFGPWHPTDAPLAAVLVDGNLDE